MTDRLLVRGATLVRPDGGTDADILVEDGVVVAIGRDLAAPAGAAEFDAAGLHAFPGAVDTHVHFNEPGRADWRAWPPEAVPLSLAEARHSATCRSTTCH